MKDASTINEAIIAYLMSVGEQQSKRRANRRILGIVGIEKPKQNTAINEIIHQPRFA
jgi:hypothetical protein